MCVRACVSNPSWIVGLEKSQSSGQNHEDVYVDDYVSLQDSLTRGWALLALCGFARWKKAPTPTYTNMNAVVLLFGPIFPLFISHYLVQVFFSVLALSVQTLRLFLQGQWDFWDNVPKRDVLKWPICKLISGSIMLRNMLGPDSNIYLDQIRTYKIDHFWAILQCFFFFSFWAWNPISIVVSQRRAFFGTTPILFCTLFSQFRYHRPQNQYMPKKNVWGN